MSYIKDNLLKEEQILYYTKPHYVVFYTVFLWLAVFVFTIKVSAGVLLSGLIAILALLSFISDLVNWDRFNICIINYFIYFFGTFV